MDKVLPINTILNGDCLELLKTLPDESVDAVCTDPPYGLGTREPTGEDIEKYLRGESLDTGGDFMGKEWEIPPVAVWRECFRVLKPGGHVAAFAGCYDELTEVLTRRGWVKFPDVTIDDEFASMDLSSMKVEWQRPKEIVRQPHDGQMIRYKTNKIDLLVTPNHKVVTSSMKAREYRLERADSHPPRVRMLKTSKGRVDEEDLGVFCLPAVMQTTSQGHQIELPEKVIPLDAWLPFFGLYLAKGSTSLIKNKLQNSHEHGSSYNVSISHFDTENLREIQRRLSEWFDVKLYLEIGLIHINDKQLQSYLSQFGKARERFIPNWVKRLPPSRLRVLWDWYMRGGGHAHRVGYTSSTRLRDDFQEIAMYMGMSADWVTRKPKKEFASINGRTITNHRPLYDVTFNHVQNYPQVSATRGRNPPRTVLSAQDWGGCMVYCVELERHHTLYVRRNGKAVWCGNTRTWDIMSVGIRAAGFEKRDTIATLFGPLSILCWVQGQGFPKSHNVFKTDIVPMVQEALVEKGYAAPFNWKHDNEAMVPGEAPETVEVTLFDIAFQITKHRDNEWELPYDLVKWKGYGTALKPSFEPILVFRKPLEGTLAETVLGGGAGVIDIDGTRVKHASAEDKAAHQAMVEAIKARAGVWQGSWKNSSNLAGAADVSDSGRWPPNVIVMHSSECRQVGTKKVDAPVINQFEEGMKPFGKAAGKKYKSKKTGDSEGKEEVTVWECVDGCPVKLLNGENSSKTEKVDAAKFFPQFQIPEAPFFYTGKATRREKNEGVVEKKTLPGFVQLKADLTEEQLELAYKTCDLLHPEKPDQGFDEKLIPESIKELFEPFTGDPVNSHPCLHPDAFVLTDRGYRPIGMIEVGNKVYAADGTFRTVSDVTRHPYTSPNLFEIHVKGTNLPVQASDNHPFLIWRPTRHKGRVTGGAVSWVRADEIQKGDYTMTPVLKEADSCSLPSDPELWFLFGLYLAEGVLQPAGHGNNKYPSYTLSKDEADLVDRIQAFFGSERVSIYDKPGTHAVQVMAFSPEHGALFETWGGRHSDKKALAPELWTLNRACQKAVLDGWLAGDGGSVRQHEQGKTISFNLAAHIRLLAESNGMRCRIARTEAVEGAGIGDRLFKTTKPCYQLDITKAEEKAGPRWVDYDGTRYAISYVDKVEAVPYRGDVVNLSVEGNPTFQTSVGMSHNTVKPVKLMEWLVSLVCPKDGVVVDPYCGSGTTCLAAVNKGIRFVGIEKDPEFFNIALKRLEPVKSAQEDKEFFKDTFDFMASLDME